MRLAMRSSQPSWRGTSRSAAAARACSWEVNTHRVQLPSRSISSRSKVSLPQRCNTASTSWRSWANRRSSAGVAPFMAGAYGTKPVGPTGPFEAQNGPIDRWLPNAGPPRTAVVLVILALVGGCSATKPAAGRATTPSPSPSVSASTALPPTGGAASQATPALRPPIVWNPIPFPDSRKMEMAAYAREHYRLDTFRLEHPQVIVEHFTATSSFRVAYNTFASNAPD